MKIEEKIQQLQLMEQSLQQLLLQKQAFQAQLVEIESAQRHLKDSDVAYKIVGNIMVKTDKTTLEKDLKEKNEILTVRIKNIEKQEEATKENVKKLREEVLNDLKKSEGGRHGVSTD